jgi:hypothetical protein
MFLSAGNVFARGFRGGGFGGFHGGEFHGDEFRGGGYGGFHEGEWGGYRAGEGYRGDEYRWGDNYAHRAYYGGIYAGPSLSRSGIAIYGAGGNDVYGDDYDDNDDNDNDDNDYED